MLPPRRFLLRGWQRWLLCFVLGLGLVSLVGLTAVGAPVAQPIAAWVGRSHPVPSPALVAAPAVPHPPIAQSNQVRPQLVRPERTWEQIYQLVPSLPLENGYSDRRTGDINLDNTLVGRIIEYHTRQRNRSPFYRLDWKLTLADYLGVNEALGYATYPGVTTLDPHPMEGDRAAVAALSRAERAALVEALVLTFNPNYLINLQNTPADPLSNINLPSANEAPSPVPGGSLIPLPSPGAADLLAP